MFAFRRPYRGEHRICHCSINYFCLSRKAVAKAGLFLNEGRVAGAPKLALPTFHVATELTLGLPRALTAVSPLQVYSVQPRVLYNPGFMCLLAWHVDLPNNLPQ